MIQWMQRKTYSFEQLKTLASFGGADLLLIEGYKREAGEKLALIRNESERAELEAMQGVIHTADSEKLFADASLLDGWLQEWLKEGRHDETI